MKSVKFLTTLAAGLILLAGFPMTGLQNANAATVAEPIGKVIAVKNSGYTTRLQQSVKQTIKVGDILYAGDQIDVKNGNFVQIAFDKDKNNIVHIPGDSLVQITKDRAINVELTHGQVFALLDRLESGTQFRIVTPTAVSTVRGTYFGVKQIGTATQTSVYRGEVAVNGRQADGKNIGAVVPVMVGERTTVAHTGTRPDAPKQMTHAQFEEINGVIASLNGLKKPISYAEMAIEKTKADARNAADKDLDGSAKDADVNGNNASGRVVF
jgi:hypothetical protein